jgi:hypothetical protein
VSYCLRTTYTVLGDAWGALLDCANLQQLYTLRP